jgi:hypothetical protein
VLIWQLKTGGSNVPHLVAISILNTTHDTETYSYRLGRLIAAFVANGQLVAPETADVWLDDLEKAHEVHEYMFCSMAVVTCAVAAQSSATTREGCPCGCH